MQRLVLSIDSRGDPLGYKLVGRDHCPDGFLQALSNNARNKGSRMSISIAVLVQLIDGYVRQKLGQEQGETLFEDLVTGIEEVL